MTPTVTYTGTEIALVAGALAVVLSQLDGDDREVMDLLLDKALAAFPGPISPDLAARVERCRTRKPFVEDSPVDRGQRKEPS